MKLKRYDRYAVNLNGKWITRCAALMGVSLFLRVVYFFGLMNFTQCNAGQIIFDMVLTMGLSVAFLVMLGALKRNAPGLYAIFGAAFFFILMVQSFASGNALRIILAVLGYCFAGLVLIATVAGYLPGKLLSSVAILLPLAVRFFCFDLGNLGVFQWVLELSCLLILVSLFCLTRSLYPVKLRNTDEKIEPQTE